LRSVGTKNVSGSGTPRGRASASWLIFAAAPRYRSVSAGDSVSASALLSKPKPANVGGQHRRGVDLDTEQIANRVSIFRAVQPLERRTAWIRIRRAALSSSASR
jgi:hypothetical protein